MTLPNDVHALMLCIKYVKGCPLILSILWLHSEHILATSCYRCRPGAEGEHEASSWCSC